MTDRERVYCLLRSLASHIRAPRGSLSSRAHGLDTEHGRWVRCSRCAEGRVVGDGEAAAPCPVCREAARKRLPAPLEHGCRPCLNCRDGWRRARAGEVAEDPYLIKGRHQLIDLYAQRAALQQRLEDEESRRRSLERRLADEQAVRDGQYWKLSPEGWEQARDEIRRRGSYAQLDRALAWLADHETLAYRVLMSVEVNEEPVRVSDSLRDTLDGIVDLLVRRIRLEVGAAQIMVPYWLLEEWRRTRLHELFAANMGFREVAAELGMSERRVRELRREWAERRQLVA